MTSTWDSFPPLPPESTSEPSAIASTALGTIPSAPNTPLFSPIPFLHTDARRSRSRSPPPSPLALNSVDPAGGVPVLGLESSGLGLVDEMDDPRPGHMSDHPTALSSVTSVGEGSSVKSLEDRFVKSSEEKAGSGAAEDSGEPEAKRQKHDEVEDMVLDEREGDKENKS